MERCLHRSEWSIAAAFAQAVDSYVNTLRTIADGSQRVAHSKVVVVVGMEIKVLVGEACGDILKEYARLCRCQYSEGVGKHKALDADALQGLYHVINIVGAVTHAIAPVLKIDVDAEACLLRHSHISLDVGDVLVGSLRQLMYAMVIRTLGEHVDDLAAAVGNPLYGLAVINESEHFDAVQGIRSAAVFYRSGRQLLRIAAYHGDGLLLAFRDTCRGNLDTVDLHIFQQKTCDAQFLMRQERHPVGLFAIAERGVKNFY